MSIFSSIRGWRTARQRKAYVRDYGEATPEEAAEIKELKVRWRRQLRARSGGLPDGTGISPSGRPIDWTADEKPPKY